MKIPSLPPYRLPKSLQSQTPMLLRRKRARKMNENAFLQ
jgi:hypothetical protein